MGEIEKADIASFITSICEECSNCIDDLQTKEELITKMQEVVRVSLEIGMEHKINFQILQSR